MEETIAYQIRNIESIINTEIDKNNYTDLGDYQASLIQNAFIFEIVTNKELMKQPEKDSWTLVEGDAQPQSILGYSSACCNFAMEALSTNPQRALFLLSMAYFYFGQYKQLKTDGHSNKSVKTEKSKRALTKRHAPNREIKNKVIAHYLNNKTKYQSKDHAAEMMIKELNVCRSFRTVRGWLINK